MEFAVLGWPPDGPTLRLDHERFAYAGKFVMSATGKAVYRDGGDVVAAVAFDADRTDPRRLRLRYLTVRDDRRGEGLGPRLADAVATRAADHDFERVAIAVNNPYAYEGLYRAGFAFTGETTGLAEVVLERPAGESGLAAGRNGHSSDSHRSRYLEGLDEFADREKLSAAESDFIAEKRDVGPPTVLDPEERL